MSSSWRSSVGQGQANLRTRKSVEKIKTQEIYYKTTQRIHFTGRSLAFNCSVKVKFSDVWHNKNDTMYHLMTALYDLNDLKQSSVLWYNILISAGMSMSGELHRLNCSAKLKYKNGIRNSYIDFEACHNDELYDNLLGNGYLIFGRFGTQNFGVIFLVKFRLMVVITTVIYCW
jgi:hypothetical protein